MAWIAVAAGGALGSVARHAVNKFAHQAWPVSQFPIATAIVNLAGCFVIGILAGLVTIGRMPLRTHWREFVFVGILGGFTTFSTFGLDTITLLRGGHGAQAVLNVASQVTLGLLLLYLGMVAAERLA